MGQVLSTTSAAIRVLTPVSRQHRVSWLHVTDAFAFRPPSRAHVRVRADHGSHLRPGRPLLFLLRRRPVLPPRPHPRLLRPGVWRRVHLRQPHGRRGRGAARQALRAAQHHRAHPRGADRDVHRRASSWRDGRACQGAAAERSHGACRDVRPACRRLSQQTPCVLSQPCSSCSGP